MVYIAFPFKGPPSGLPQKQKQKQKRNSIATFPFCFFFLFPPSNKSLGSAYDTYLLLCMKILV